MTGTKKKGANFGKNGTVPRQLKPPSDVSFRYKLSFFVCLFVCLLLCFEGGA